MPGVLRFDASAYYAELIRVQADPWWETVPRRTGKALTALLDARPELLARWGTRLEVACGYQREGQGILEIWLWHTGGSYRLQLHCPQDVRPETQAHHLVERLGRVDPARWAERTH